MPTTNTPLLLQGEATPSFLRQYETLGYVLVPNLLTATECQFYKDEGKRLLAAVASPNQSVFVGVSGASPLFYALASDERFAAPLSQIFPEGVDFMSDKFVWKSPRHRFATPWHQDIAYWPGTRSKVSVWVALDDVTAVNGAMKIIPGSHRELARHENISGGSVNGEFGNVISGLPEVAPGELLCAMQAGSALFFSDLLIHSSCPSQGGAERYALISTYHASSPVESYDVQFPARHRIWAP